MNTELKSKRKCGECTKCCEGWLSANILGFQMKPGVKCHFFGSKCTIYSDRPDLCRNFRCAWLSDEEYAIPEWLKPSLSNIIITTRLWGENQEPYWSVVECGQGMSAEILHWLISFTARNNICVEYRLNGGVHHRGSEEFVNFMNGG
jgi:Fe-S-cluster containining protein